MRKGKRQPHGLPGWQKINNSTKKHTYATKLSRKGTKAKPHMENTELHVSAGGKLNWNSRYLHEKESKEMKQVKQHPTLSNKQMKQKQRKKLWSSWGNDRESIKKLKLALKWKCEKKNNKLNRPQHMDHCHNSNFQCPVFDETITKKTISYMV